MLPQTDIGPPSVHPLWFSASFPERELASTNQPNFAPRKGDQDHLLLNPSTIQVAQRQSYTHHSSGTSYLLSNDEMISYVINFYQREES